MDDDRPDDPPPAERKLPEIPAEWMEKLQKFPLVRKSMRVFGGLIGGFTGFFAAVILAFTVTGFTSTTAIAFLVIPIAFFALGWFFPKPPLKAGFWIAKKYVALRRRRRST